MRFILWIRFWGTFWEETVSQELLWFFVTVVLPSPAPLSSATLCPCPLHAGSSTHQPAVSHFRSLTEQKTMHYSLQLDLQCLEMEKELKWASELQAIPTVSSQPYQKSNFKPPSADLRRATHCSIWFELLIDCIPQHLQNKKLLWIHVSFITQTPLIQHLIFQLNCKLHHWYSTFF